MESGWFAVFYAKKFAVNGYTYAKIAAQTSIYSFHQLNDGNFFFQLVFLLHWYTKRFDENESGYLQSDKKKQQILLINNLYKCELNDSFNVRWFHVYYRDHMQ